MAKINFSRKNILFAVIYKSPSQNSEQFQYFVDRLQLTLNFTNNERLYPVIVTRDLNCRSSQWWTEDIENIEGSALDDLIETNNMQQLIDEPAYVRGEGMSWFVLIITDQPNMFVEAGVHPSLDEYCPHQIV